MAQTAYPQPGGCQPCLPHPFPAETATGCTIKAPWEESSFPAARCSPHGWLGVGSGEPWGLQLQDTPLPGWPSGLVGGPYPAWCAGVKHTSAFCSFSSEKTRLCCAGCQISAKYPGRFCRVFRAVRGCLF